MTRSGPVVAVALGMRIPALFAIVTMILLVMCVAMVAGVSAAAAGIAGISASWLVIVIVGWAPRDGME
jgi:hypothetical protein